MSLKATMTIMKAWAAQRKGLTEQALSLYEEGFAAGGGDPKYMLAYAILLIRNGEFAKAKDLLVKHQRMPGMTPEQKSELINDYAVCVYKLGEPEKAIAKMEENFRKNPTGNIYQTLGYFYVDQCDQANRPADDEPAPVVAEAPAEEAAEGEDAVPQEAPKTPAQLFDERLEKARVFLEEAVEYDDEDPIVLDNLAQYYYRCLGDKQTAKTWFEKAIAIKEGQIDTLWFLSRYDLEAGNKDAALEKLTLASEGRFSPLNFKTKDEVLAEIERLKA